MVIVLDNSSLNKSSITSTSPSLILSATLSAVSKFLTPASLPGGSYLWQAINTVVAFGLISALFAMLFKVLPDVTLGWRDV
jgi:membrane protein